MKRLYTAVKIVVGGELASTAFYARILQDSQLNYVAVDEMFEQWRRNVPLDRRWGDDEVNPPSVSVVVEGVLLPR